MVRYDSLRVFLAMTTQLDLELIQFDVKTAFLHGEVKEELYLKIPDGLKVDGDSNIVMCRLNKSLYGIKQAARCWNAKFTVFLRRLNFMLCESENCIYVGKIKNIRVFLALFVNDGLIACESYDVLEFIVNELSKSFEITLGDASMFVGLQIERNRIEKLMRIHQRAYIMQIIERFGMNDAKTVSIPADPHAMLSSIDGNESEIPNVPYREAVGSLMFLAMISRPDIAFAVNALSRYLNKYNQYHWNAAKRVFRYLKETAELGIMYKSGRNDFILEGYSDADFAGDIETRRSTTGYVFMLANGPVTWTSQRQQSVTLSTTEAEYVAAAAAAKETMWLRKLMNDIGCRCKEATIIYIDNQSAIQLVKNPVYHKRTKHIDIRYHFLREKVEENELKVSYIPSSLQ